MFKKRGELSFISILEILIGVLILYLFYSSASSIGDEDRLEEFARAKDIALLIEAMQATNQDITYVYPETIYGSNVQIENQVVSILPDVLRVARLEFFSTSQFGFDILNPYRSVLAATVNGAFFTINKEEENIFFSNQTSTLTELSTTSIIKREDIKISIRYDETRYEDFLEQVTNTVKGELQQIISLEEPTTHYLGFSYGDSAIIYYADTQDMKQLALKLQERFSATNLEFTALVKTPMFTSGEEAIQIEFDQKTKDTIATRLPIFALEVKQTYEKHFEE